MASLVNSPARPVSAIDGVYQVEIVAYEDPRGRFMETFRTEWFPQVSWARMQSNRSDSKAGVLRGLHYHFHQVDYWYVVKGRIRAGMVDLRPQSPTYKATLTVELGEENNIGLFIPIGVAHGFAALTDCTLTYVVNNYYGDGSDERGVRWDDAEIGVVWGIENPLISQRDLQNRLLRDIPLEELPR